MSSLNNGHAHTSMPTTLSEKCTCGISAGFRTICPVGTCLSHKIGTVAVGRTVGVAVLVVTGALLWSLELRRRRCVLESQTSQRERVVPAPQQ